MVRVSRCTTDLGRFPWNKPRGRMIPRCELRGECMSFSGARSTRCIILLEILAYMAGCGDSLKDSRRNNRYKRNLFRTRSKCFVSWRWFSVPAPAVITTLACWFMPTVETRPREASFGVTADTIPGPGWMTWQKLKETRTATPAKPLLVKDELAVGTPGQKRQATCFLLLPATCPGSCGEV